MEYQYQKRTEEYVGTLFTILNESWFGGILDSPIINIISSSRVYAHYRRCEYVCVGTDKILSIPEINISSGAVDGTFENLIVLLLHEMVHMYNDTVRNVQDVSRKNTYHNKLFAETCMTHGLDCQKTKCCGWSHTIANDTLTNWIQKNRCFESNNNWS